MGDGKGPNEAIVSFSDDQAERLTRLYTAAEAEILREVNRGIVAGNETSYLQGMLQNVRSILNDLNHGARNWSSSAIPAVYNKAIEYADEEMKNAGIQGGFGAIHQQAAHVLAESTFNRLQDLNQFIGRRVDDIFRQLSLDAVRGSVIGYESYQKSAKKLKDNLKEHGITGFVDKSGRAWNMSTYADTVAIATTAEAHLEGTKNRLTEYGRDLVQVSFHTNPCPKCAPWEGKILSLTGTYDGPVQIDGTLDQAKSEGLFHVRCKHAYGLYVPALMGDTPTPQANAKPKRAPKQEPKPQNKTIADQVNEHLESIGGTVRNESDVQAVGDMVRKEIESRLSGELKKLEDQVAALTKEQEAKFKAYWDSVGVEFEKTDGLKAEFDKATEALKAAQDSFKTKIAEVRAQVIAEVRQLGGGPGQPWASGSHKSVKDAFNAIEKYLPTDWLGLSSNSEMKARKVQRGFYRQSLYGQPANYCLSGQTAKGMERVAIHEMGHRFEDVVPNIKRLEYEFYQRRTQGEPLKWLGDGYAKTEKTRFDQFLNPYMGKDYGNKETSYFELLSMGLEGLFRPSNFEIEKDQDFYNFILGLLTGVKS